MPDRNDPVDAPGFVALLRLLREGHVWVKLSHPYKIDPGGSPYPGTLPIARALVDTAPERVLWGSDWPHPIVYGAMPNDGDLIDLLPRWAGSLKRARRILVDNPRTLYAGSMTG